MIAIDWLMKIRNKLLGALRVSLPSQDTQPKLRNTNKIAIKRILNHSSYHDESLMISPGRAGVNLSPMTKRQRYSSVNCLRDLEDEPSTSPTEIRRAFSRKPCIQTFDVCCMVRVSDRNSDSQESQQGHCALRTRPLMIIRRKLCYLLNTNSHICGLNLRPWAPLSNL